MAPTYPSMFGGGVNTATTSPLGGVGGGSSVMPIVAMPPLIPLAPHEQRIVNNIQRDYLDLYRLREFYHSQVNNGCKNPLLLKTTLCDHWRDYGRCKYGQRCWYAHGEQELRSVPRLDDLPTRIANLAAMYDQNEANAIQRQLKEAKTQMTSQIQEAAAATLWGTTFRAPARSYSMGGYHNNSGLNQFGAIGEPLRCGNTTKQLLQIRTTPMQHQQQYLQQQPQHRPQLQQQQPPTPQRHFNHFVQPNYQPRYVSRYQSNFYNPHLQSGAPVPLATAIWGVPPSKAPNHNSSNNSMSTMATGRPSSRESWASSVGGGIGTGGGGRSPNFSSDDDAVLQHSKSSSSASSHGYGSSNAISPIQLQETPTPKYSTWPPCTPWAPAPPINNVFDYSPMISTSPLHTPEVVRNGWDPLDLKSLKLPLMEHMEKSLNLEDEEEDKIFKSTVGDINNTSFHLNF